MAKTDEYIIELLRRTDNAPILVDNSDITYDDDHTINFDAHGTAHESAGDIFIWQYTRDHNDGNDELTISVNGSTATRIKIQTIAGSLRDMIVSDVVRYNIYIIYRAGSFWHFIGGTRVEPVPPFDLYEDVTTQVSPSLQDRMVVASALASGNPNRYMLLSALKTLIGFDLADDVTTVLTTLADDDIFLIADESDSNAMKRVTYERLTELFRPSAGKDGTIIIEDPFVYNFRGDDITVQSVGGQAWITIAPNIREVSSDPSAADVTDREMVIVRNSDNAAQKAFIKTSRKNPFFSVTVDDLGNEQLGYAASGYDGVNAGGTSGYSNLGSILERLSVDFQGAFTRVGSTNLFGVSEHQAKGLAYHDGTLYMVGGSADALYRLDLTTGGATRIGSATAFGVSENVPSGLASHNGTLYMVGADTDILYTLDTTTGEATRVGSTTSGFGVSEGNPNGLASHNGTLYMIGFSHNRLYTLDTTTGAATQVGSASNFGVLETEPSGLTSAFGRLYMVGKVNDALFTLNTTTGEATFESSPPRFSINEQSAGGIASHNGTLYMVGANNALYSLDDVGYATRIGSVTNFGASVTSPTGLASHNGTLYMVSTNNDALYTVDTTTGRATRIGSANRFGVGEDGAYALASHNGTLYMTGFTNDALYTLDTTTGVATQVGSANRYGVNESSPSGLASHNGVLYMIGGQNDALYTVDTTTGEATRVGNADDFGIVNESNPSGLTSHNGVLYMVGVDTDALYVLDTETGEASYPGVAYRFGLSLGSVSGISVIDTTLYIVDENADYLAKLDGMLGNRWIARFPEDTTEVGDDDDTLKLFVGADTDVITLERDSSIGDAVAFRSESDGQSSHTISDGDTISVALYKEDNTQLYEGSTQAAIAELSIKELPIGV